MAKKLTNAFVYELLCGFNKKLSANVQSKKMDDIRRLFEINFMIVNVYTDASHCQVNRVATCGFAVYVCNKMVKHSVIFIGNINSIYFAEYIAVTHALYHCFLMEGVEKIYVHTDCIDAVLRSESKMIHKRYEFIGDMLDTLEIIKDHGVYVQLRYVRSHAKNRRHNFIDNSVHRQLKNFLKNQNNETKDFKDRHPVTYYRSNNRL